MDIKKYIINKRKYFNFLTLMQVTNIAMLIYILKYCHLPIDMEDIYGYFLFGFPFLANIFMQIHIKKYEQFYLRDIWMLLFISVYSGLLLLCLIVFYLVLIGLS